MKIFFVIFAILACFSCHSMQSDLETYIVQVESPESQISTQPSRMDLESWYKSFMPKTIETASSDEKPQLIYSYHNVIIGFAARLSAKQVKEMEKKPGFIFAWPQRILSLHTTHSPSFLELQQNVGLWRDDNYGEGVIIGLFDTGITPDHPSFSDEGMPPPPAKWKGKCDSNFTGKCNNKLIGAKTYPLNSESPKDEAGHGTHTSSTAAGNFVKGANVYGNAKGTAVGIAPLAHLAMYKVCDNDCLESAILAGMDEAIDDGVDIMSLSLGGGSRPFYYDVIALGAYSAAKRGILVSCSAGNGGPSQSTISNEAPWILTVGASTIDRELKATVMLGNQKLFEGESVFSPKVPDSSFYPLIDPSLNATHIGSRFREPGTLSDPKFKDKIVVCMAGGYVSTIGKGQVVKDAGGVGMILVSIPEYGFSKFADPHVLPALYITFNDGMEILQYINSTSEPTARISFHGTIIGDKEAPVVAAFSSRGPSYASPGILKPDIIGPGNNILAAWHTSVDYEKHTKSAFNIIQGTSMSCSHLSGVAALLKSSHRNWSPSAIKSAIMTTANTLNLANVPILDERLLPADIFAIGAGHVNPLRANDPGLIYDIPIEDYLPYLCGLNYTNQQVGSIVKHKVDCNKVKHIPEAQLNYPSFSITLGDISQTYTRTVTNVGEAKSSYTVEIDSPPGVTVNVKPSTLKFSKLDQKLKYQVTFTRRDDSTSSGIAQGFLKWSCKKYSVRSPIAVVLQPTIGF
ncbi:subtilisin-like protease SBT1.7 [Solanum pennellii]|uniref:Subtilisin-like protease SBT1.7 n=1 Tax=Solanum pennellii TaxID=28526 RepID=A0ABM1HDN8_SOLPN|nr:subtilisin-like protease SBT1.7 [Solanum pennellii]